jgi:hypothetical protein
MWCATTIGWFDVVKDRDVKGGVIIKARCKADIWNVYRQFSTARKGKGRRFKMGRPISNKKWDYRYGIKMQKKVWAQIIYRLTMQIDYSLFKGAVNARPDQHNKHSAYLTIWSTMLRVQHNEEDRLDGAGQGHFDYAYDWQREIDFANQRFEAEQAVPTKTIKTVLAEKQAKEDNNEHNEN